MVVRLMFVARKERSLIHASDDARLHSSPVYVHCKAGKSRSVTVVLAYLIYANAWTLKTAYAYVAERRKGISPNIGFVAELMAFEETELGLKQSGGVHGDTQQQSKDSARDSASGSGSGAGKPRRSSKTKVKGRPSTGTSSGSKGSGLTSLEQSDSSLRQGASSSSSSNSRPRPARESLPPKWTGASSSLETRPPGPLPLDGSTGDGGQGGKGEDRERDQDREDGKGRTLRDEREVMKNGQWVQQRRSVVVSWSIIFHLLDPICHSSAQVLVI
jgi:hypothetical protein